MVLALIALPLAGCNGGGGGPTTSNPPPPPTTTIPPNALHFPAGKYVNSETSFDTFTFAYTIFDEGVIAIGIKAKTSGWVALAMGNPHGQSDVMIGYVSFDGEVVFLDTHDARESGGHPLDTAFGGKDDLYDVSGSEGNGITTIEFKRKLNTGDSYDLPFIVGTNILTWAIAVNDSLGTEHSSIGVAIVEVPEPTHP